MNKQPSEVPKFESESDEADWWASRAGRAYVKQKSTESKSTGTKVKGSSLVEQMNKKSSVQIAIRLPQAIWIRPENWRSLIASKLRVSAPTRWRPTPSRGSSIGGV
jgi:hypothetical protein